jgi:two-component system, NtrC family, sensor histidine kinase HydH
MPRFSVLSLTLLAAFLLTGGLAWQALRDYQSAAPVAQENLRGLALTMATAMEGVAARDPSLKALASFQTPEIAYAALLATDGRILFHTNPDLTGSDVKDERFRPVLASGGLSEKRIRLGTGEMVYEFQTPVHLSGQTCVLRLALHTWRADSVMRRARQGMMVIFSLLVVGWLLGAIIIRLLQRQAVRQRQAARQQELARLGEVGAILAHEIRNPLAGIKGYGQLLQERLSSGRERGYADLIVSEAQRLERLAHDILLYTRSSSPASASCHPAPVALEVLTLLTPQAQDLNVFFACEIGEELMVACPAEELQQVLLNLFTNALQASPPGGKIMITGRYQGKWVELTVQDDGPGIAAEMRDVLFEPFKTSKARGAGLGLAVCKKIIEGCGGHIEVKNGINGGAECLVCLPSVSPKGAQT